MAAKTTQMERVARQCLETDQMLGVDFFPMKKIDQVPSGSPAGSVAVDKTEALDLLREEHDTNCPHCAIAEGHMQTVFGEGNPNADLLFIGEAPGAEEDRTGRPFVGRAGQKLNGMIEAMGLKRQDVYIANILKSRPPDNRTPLPDEIADCAPYLAQQIRIIEPKVIVTLGAPSTKFVLQTTTGISRLRGQWAVYEDGDLRVDVMPTFHPAYLLRNYTRDTREKVWSDLQSVMARLDSK